MAGFAIYTSTYGPIRLDWEDGAITRLRIVTQAETADGYGQSNELTDEAFTQISQFFAGELQQFTVPIAFTVGTPFQKEVWKELLQIPYGQTRTYGQIAQAVGRPKAVRAVGSANNRNPLPILVPCHRVVGVGGRLVGYAYGIDMKRDLLNMELQHVQPRVEEVV